MSIFNGTIPDRLSADRESQHYDSRAQYLNVKVDGKVKKLCVEYCVSEGWIKEIQRYDDGTYRYSAGGLHTLTIRGKVTVEEITK